MHLNDPIADLLTRMRNAQHARKTECAAPWSKIKEQICELLKREGYLSSVEVRDEGEHKELVVTFDGTKPPLSLKRISSPGSRRYVGSDGVRTYKHGFATAILSTSSGIITDKEAKAKKVGGELLCLVS